MVSILLYYSYFLVLLALYDFLLVHSIVIAFITLFITSVYILKNKKIKKDTHNRLMVTSVNIRKSRYNAVKYTKRI